MIMNYPYKFRLEPTPEQSLQLKNYADTCRFIYNIALEQRNLASSPEPLPSLVEIWEKRQIENAKREKEKEQGIKRERKEVDYESEGKKEIHHKGINYAFQCKELTTLRNHLDWVYDVPVNPQQGTLRNLDTAFSNFFQRVKKGQRVSDSRNPYGYPVFRNRYKLSIPFKPGNVSIKVFSEKFGGDEGVYFSELKIPKIGLVKFRQTRPVEGELKTPTIKFQGNHWYVVLLTEQEMEFPEALPNSIGIDLGVANPVTTSDGEFYPTNEKHLKTLQNLEKMETRIRKLQKKCDSRKTKFSNNWKKEKRKIAVLKHKQMKSRNEFYHELSKTLTDENNLIVVEDLNIKGMTASASGTTEEPGKNVKQKSGLNRSILERGWGTFVEKLEYKSEWKGGELVKVDPKNTSRMCSVCGYVDEKNRKTQDKFLCLQCGHKEHADVNAAKNILNRMKEEM